MAENKFPSPEEFHAIGKVHRMGAMDYVNYPEGNAPGRYVSVFDAMKERKELSMVRRRAKAKAKNKYA